MEKVGHIEIKISGLRGSTPLSPDNYDISEIKKILEQADKLIVPDLKERPMITYSLEEGSVNHIFKTSVQYILGFNAIINQINSDFSIDFLLKPTANAIELFQNIAIKKNYIFEIKTSIENSGILKIDSSTYYYLTQSLWVEAEFYFYGDIINMGGKNKSNLHINTEEFGSLIIQTDKLFLEELINNPLYKTYGVRASGKQNSLTGEIDKKSLKFIELINYQPQYDSGYLETLRNKAKQNWIGKISADDLLNEIREYK